MPDKYDKHFYATTVLVRYFDDSFFWFAVHIEDTDYAKAGDEYDYTAPGWYYAVDFEPVHVNVRAIDWEGPYATAQEAFDAGSKYARFSTDPITPEFREVSHLEYTQKHGLYREYTRSRDNA